MSDKITQKSLKELGFKRVKQHALTAPDPFESRKNKLMTLKGVAYHTQLFKTVATVFLNRGEPWLVLSPVNCESPQARECLCIDTREELVDFLSDCVDMEYLLGR